MSGLLKRLLVTPIEVNDAEFTTIKGVWNEWYKASEVDDLLDAVVITMQRFLATNRELSRNNMELKRILRQLKTEYPNSQTLTNYLKENTL
ncbi:DivIVA domain-containing protein [Bifidobacterium moukalabense]|uniref:DivIVA domain-containing protein n=1 Tax=Bifidobacterium moukalabense TaxID=1333651 RepID=UPI0010F58D03|nr:DivIVA domain-containing protein [Bifidobacterium moukalabense]